MKKFYLLQGTCEVRNSADNIVDISTIHNIQLFHYIPDDQYILRIICNGFSSDIAPYQFWFNTKEELINTTKELLIELDTYPAYADCFNIIDVEHDARQTIEQVKEMMEASKQAQNMH